MQRFLQRICLCAMVCLTTAWADPEATETSGDYEFFRSLNDLAPYRCIEQQSNTLYGIFLKKSEGPVSEDLAEVVLSSHLSLEVASVSCDTEHFPDRHDTGLWRGTDISKSQLVIQTLKHLKCTAPCDLSLNVFSINEATGRGTYIWLLETPTDPVGNSANSLFLTKQILVCFTTGVAISIVTGYLGLPEWVVIPTILALIPPFIAGYNHQQWGPSIAAKGEVFFTHAITPFANHSPRFSNFLWVYIGQHMEKMIDTYFYVHQDKQK